MPLPLASPGLERQQVTSLRLRYDFEVDPDGDSVHAKLLHLVGAGKRVLELGCATGYLSRIMRDRGCQVVAVEIDHQMAERARPYCERIIIGDMEQLDLTGELGDDRFDVVLAADVLEHLKRPEEILRTLKGCLRPGGYFVVSVPNISHGSVRLAMLQGRFCYTERGLLDRTHLQFFTWETAARLFEDQGFAVVHLERQELLIDQSEVKYDPARVPPQLLESLNQDPEARTYQLVFVAHPLPWPGMEWVQQWVLRHELEKQTVARELALAREIIDARQTALAKSEGMVQELIQSRDAAVHHCQELQAQVQTLTHELASLRQAAQSQSEAAVRELATTREAAARELATYRETAARELLASREAAAHELAAIRESDARELAASRQSAEQEAADLRGRIQTLTNELAAVRSVAQGQAEAATKEKESALKEKEELRARLHTICQRENEIRANWLEVQDQLLQRDDEFQRVVQELSGQRDRLIAERSELINQRESLVAERGEFVRQVGALTAERAEFVRQVDVLSAERAAFVHQRECLAAERAEERAKLENSIAILNCQLHSLQAEHAVLIAVRNNVENRLAQVRNSLPGRLYRGLRHLFHGMRRVAIGTRPR